MKISVEFDVTDYTAAALLARFETPADGIRELTSERLREILAGEAVSVLSNWVDNEWERFESVAELDELAERLRERKEFRG